jgi:hypothetical protein
MNCRLLGALAALAAAAACGALQRLDKDVNSVRVSVVKELDQAIDSVWTQKRSANQPPPAGYIKEDQVKVDATGPSAKIESGACTAERLAQTPLGIEAGNQTRVFFMAINSEMIKKDEQALLADLFDAYLSPPDNVTVVTMKDMQAVLSVDKQQQILGCNDDKCVGDVSSMVGADFVISGTLAKLGGNLVLSIRIIRMHNSKAESKAIVEFKDMNCLNLALKLAAQELIKTHRS